MDRNEVIKQIAEKDPWGFRVKDEFLDELEEAANEEGCEWGEQVPQVIELYRNLQPDYVSKAFVKALYAEIIDLYMCMLEWTEIEETPEEDVLVKKPASKRRVWKR